MLLQYWSVIVTITFKIGWEYSKVPTFFHAIIDSAFFHRLLTGKCYTCCLWITPYGMQCPSFHTLLNRFSHYSTLRADSRSLNHCSNTFRLNRVNLRYRLPHVTVIIAMGLTYFHVWSLLTFASLFKKPLCSGFEPKSMLISVHDVFFGSRWAGDLVSQTFDLRDANHLRVCSATTYLYGASNLSDALGTALARYTRTSFPWITRSHASRFACNLALAGQPESWHALRSVDSLSTRRWWSFELPAVRLHDQWIHNSIVNLPCFSQSIRLLHCLYYHVIMADVCHTSFHCVNHSLWG